MAWRIGYEVVLDMVPECRFYLVTASSLVKWPKGPVRSALYFPTRIARKFPKAKWVSPST